MNQLVLVRHGQSEYNLKNIFTGWLNPDLTEKGIQEAQETGNLLKEKNLIPEIVFTSALTRAQNTMWEILKVLKLTELPVVKNEALNERNYGDLAGKNKAETAEKFGAEQVHIWRRSFDVRPPGGESLKDTAERCIPYFEKNILPELQKGQDVLVVAHGNSLRSLVMHIEKLSPEEILKREIKTGQAIVYNFGDNQLLPSGE